MLLDKKRLSIYTLELNVRITKVRNTVYKFNHPACALRRLMGCGEIIKGSSSRVFTFSGLHYTSIHTSTHL